MGPAGSHRQLAAHVTILPPPSPSGLLAGLAYTQVRPPNYSPDRLPETSFTCEDKVSGSYYADVEASCQLFHVCVQVSELEVSLIEMLNA